MKPLKEKDYIRNIKKAKTFEAYKMWVENYRDYKKMIALEERKMSNHLGVRIEFDDV